MRAGWQRWADFFADRLTVAERWLLAIAMVVVVTGALVKHYRSRPQPLPSPATASQAFTPSEPDP